MEFQKFGCIKSSFHMEDPNSMDVSFYDIKSFLCSPSKKTKGCQTLTHTHIEYKYHFVSNKENTKLNEKHETFICYIKNEDIME